MHITYDLPVTIKDIIEAKHRLAGRVYKTGMPRSNYFSECCKGDIFLKFENMQRTGSFKIRGAFNKLCSLTDTEKSKGVVACSAGNHAQGVSLSCAMLGIDSKVVMPKAAPKSKVAATRDYSAQVILHGDNFNETIAKVSEIVEMEGRIFIPPYDDPKVIAGQGTIGLEILEDLYDVDNIIVPIGGGGLISGIALAIKSINPTIKVIGVQAQNVHGMAASFFAENITTHRTGSTLADGCDVSRPGQITYEIVRQLVDNIVLVSEDEIRNSIIALIQRNKVVTEGAGALACAALLSGKLDSDIQNRKTVSIISGGNIDLSRISQIIDFVDA
ncbi:bifunctional threonine ammonia-lyase/L-serine ammonia-lyase TdcB [Escherichia fergusonii]|uniref:bifunctional threonine ammonia-lyase/L-serine ammonia-lyase TdcB n=1 Tax=Escherichia fergusonii TaxID=564 RepID=UPI0015F691CC|nr:bifunctional threonine ammonia-lyase/L-serine ammonia-lyase TdcB [Escherichia fergusonii]MBA5616328.1 bifunctional threonine ammonia-lyase/L-serine ammonia-lyase TdcB [Escherichia fergusonii]MBA5664615.1 bifunctional threonine ammonia-lyase/L-serine ammonia-lyase TdcB [Escherichia fergusonii]MBA8158996.1 bifunctional threonine ammonia-lyase/L-serine ammonia-lyase TdcB [Escherichia fergusonii]MBA8172306.1 bifunctional threonine ammonia-lyase/L-serine ammonia-lyase TdcB [Escherichia fergusonii